MIILPVSDDVGNEFYRHMHRIAGQIRTDDESYPELVGVYAHVAFDAQGRSCKTRLIINNYLPDLLG